MHIKPLDKWKNKQTLFIYFYQQHITILFLKQTRDCMIMQLLSQQKKNWYTYKDYKTRTLFLPQQRLFSLLKFIKSNDSCTVSTRTTNARYTVVLFLSLVIVFQHKRTMQPGPLSTDGNEAWAKRISKVFLHNLLHHKP